VCGHLDTRHDFTLGPCGGCTCERFHTERDKLLSERDDLAEDLGDLLDVARQVPAAAARSVDLPTDLALAINALDDVLERFDDEPWQPRRPHVQADQEQQ
jgi:hypothetical protein